MTAELKQYCPYCSGKIAYPSEMAGTAINCPHCQREVELAKDVRQECRSCGEKVVFSESMVGEQVRGSGCGKMLKLHRPASEALWRPGSTQETGAAKSQYYLAMRGKTEGPFTEAEVCSYIEKNWVRGDTRVQVGTGGAWFVLSQFQQFTVSLMKQNAPKVVEEETFVDDGLPDITVLLDDKHHGPYTVGQIRHALETGTFDADDSARRPGMPGWRPLRKWTEFKNLEVVKALNEASGEIGKGMQVALTVVGCLILALLVAGLATSGTIKVTIGLILSATGAVILLGSVIWFFIYIIQETAWWLLLVGCCPLFIIFFWAQFRALNQLPGYLCLLGWFLLYVGRKWAGAFGYL